MSAEPLRNTLAGETSPYLQQHADNPVAWQPWCREALERARREDKPILLSIGYSACHWCHVMAHESFEDEDTAAVMNELFVNIKVDREERPDLDKIYQTAHQMLAQRPGGWPLTMFLTPDDQTPFFGGTYFPRSSRHGLPAFTDLLRGVANAYREQQEEIRTQNGSLREALTATDATRMAADTELGPAPLEEARRQLEQGFESRHGGFGGAPKFPMTAYLVRLLRHWHATAAAGQGDERAREMALYSLERMAEGGMYDHLGGGFCRYSVDDRWMIPHFEKMLYDNGPLLEAMAFAWQVTGRELFARTARETAAWVMREMQGPEGGYYSSLDADSEGEEGKYYVWDKAEVEDLLEPEELQALGTRFGLDRPPNFEGRWHLHGYQSLEDTARQLDLPAAEAAALVDGARARLLARREERVRPGRDDKVLTSWNALMIRGMARAGRILGEAPWVASAERALGFIRAHLWDGERLLATSKDGHAHLNAYLDDYAFLMDALLALLEQRWRGEDLAFCQALAEVVLGHFEDRENGGFFFTADDHEALIHRPKPLGDESVPSGNGVAARTLLRLGHLLGETRYLDAAERTLKAAWPALERIPYAHASLLEALEEWLYPPEVIILRGEGEELARWRERAGRDFAPGRLVLPIPASAADLPPALADKAPQGEGCTAYRCRGFTCSAPATGEEGLEALLAGAD